ncbi:MAG TPA: hypothetical protein PLG07_13885, partial [Phenylobacterium sp.]|nr:hypothetical protein [Phenylobacterium sp.]
QSTGSCHTQAMADSAEGSPRDKSRFRNAVIGVGIAQLYAWGVIYYPFSVTGKLMAADLGLSSEAAFGGFSLDQAPVRPDHALHRAMAGHSDCLPATERAQMPEKIFTSNLLVRRDVFAAEIFDESFTGWGWEDVEWGMRVTARWPILHVENTATHLGLDTPQTLADKYEQSAGNFARIAARHPDLIARYGSYKVAKVLKRAPLLKLWRPLLKAFALAEAAPLKTRAFALRLYRAALYVEAV